MTVDQIKAFLAELQQKKELLSSIRNASTANEITEIAQEFYFNFSGNELKAISKESIPGVKVKKKTHLLDIALAKAGIKIYFQEKSKLKELSK